MDNIEIKQIWSCAQNFNFHELGFHECMISLVSKMIISKCLIKSMAEQTTFLIHLPVSIFQNSTRVIRLLLDHKANTNLLCNGFSALALCIASGNDAVSIVTF